MTYTDQEKPMGPAVSTTEGIVTGAEQDGVHSFLGISYAAPPIDEVQYAAPQPPPRWDGTRAATSTGPVATQVPLAPPFESLLARPGEAGPDCLNLNIWTPDPGSARAPVMVWIHGGAFSTGSGSDPWYAGHTFARDGVVFVSINYRLGPYGFARFSEVVRGFSGPDNRGLLDQIAALEWIQTNISGFGGDPDNVTVFGQSAGAMSIASLLASKRADGLFRRAVCQSGAGQQGLPPEVATVLAGRLLELLDIGHCDVDQLLAVPSQRMADAASILAAEARESESSLLRDFAGNYNSFEPIIDGDLLVEPVEDAIAAGSAAGVDLLVGTTTDEWRILSRSGPDAEPADAGSVAANVDSYLHRDGVGGLLMGFYRRELGSGSPDDLLDAIETDRFFRIPAIRLAEAQLQRHAGVHMYQFSWESPAFIPGGAGASHMVDLPFVFDNFDNRFARALVGEDPPRPLAERMHASWIAFARTGDPGQPGLPDWPRYEPAGRSTMDFGEECRLLDDPRADARRLWESLARA